MPNPVDHIFAFTPESLAAWCAQRGMPAFRAKQILQWVYEKGVVDPGQMTNLAKRERDTLASEMTFLSGQTVAHKAASDGVRKLLIQWDEPGEGQAAGAAAQALPTPSTPSTPPPPAPPAGQTGASIALPMVGAPAGPAMDPSRQTECVLIPVEDEDGPSRRTACISSQIGCPVGCRFCASGLGGLDGNLSAGRIVEQVWRLRWELAGPGRAPGEDAPRVTNVVFMGMGEPLANFANVTDAIRTLNALWGMAISARKITISTVGLPAAIRKLAAQFELPVTLALSLHAPTDEIRRGLIPWAQYSTIRELLDACQEWFEKTGREITLEYTLLRGVNDRPEHAEELSRLARTLRANVNLIRYNEVAGIEFQRPDTEDVRSFQQVLRDRGVNVHIRASRGRDIAAACGQLRHEHAAQR
jgi:23S rRNA (adenine2503-C2)-methyltransferase